MAAHQRARKKAKRPRQGNRTRYAASVHDTRLHELIAISRSWYYWEQDKNFRFTRMVGSIFKRSGIHPNAFVGKTRWGQGIVPLGDGGRWDAHRATLKAHRPFTDFVFKYVSPKGELRFIATSGRPVFDDAGRFEGYRGISKDVTRRVQQQRRLAIEKNVAQQLAEARSVVEAAAQTIRTVCHALDWACGVYWQLDDRDRMLRRSAVWGIGSRVIARFLTEITRDSPLTARANSVVRRVCVRASPAWTSDIGKNASCRLSARARQAGLRGTFALPISNGGRVIGVMAFFSRETYRPDTELLQVALYIGRGLGQLVNRRQSETKLSQFRAAMDASIDTIYLVDPINMRFLDFNDAACRRTGYTREELLRVGPHDLMFKSRAYVKKLYARVIAAGTDGIQTEAAVRAKNGECAHLEMQHRAIQLDGNTVVVSVARDITARKVAEQASERLRRMYAALGALNEAILRTHRAEELYQRVCDAAVESGQFFGARVLLVDPGSTWARVAASSRFAPRDVGNVRVSIDPTVPEGRGLFAIACRTLEPCISNDYGQDPRTAPWHARARTVGFASGAVVPIVRGAKAFGGMVFYSRRKNAFDEDVVKLLGRMAENVAFALDNFDREAERRAADAAVRASEEKYRNVLANMSEGYFEIDLKGNCTFVNDALRRLLGCTYEEIIGLNYHRYYDAATARQVFRVYNKVYRTGKPVELVEWDYLHKDGTRGRWEQSIQRIDDANGRPVGFRGVVRDITHRRAAEEALRASEERFRGLTDLSSDWFWEQDAEFRFTKFEGKKVAGGRFDFGSVILGKRPWEMPNVIADSVDWERVREICRRHEPIKDLEYAYADDKCRRFYISVNGEPMFDAAGNLRGYRGTSRDITERKREERLLALEHAVTRSLAGSAGTRKTLQAVLSAICESERWQTSGFWTVDEHAGTLSLAVGWSARNAAAHSVDFYRQHRDIVVPADGLLGTVWKTGEPRWVPDVTREAGSIWRERIAATGERSTFCVPAVAAGKVIGVFAFASDVMREPDERLLRSASIIGNQVGQFLQRKQAEDVLRESEARFRALTNLSSDWYWEQDAAMRFTRVESRRDDVDVARRVLLDKRPWETGYQIENTDGWEKHQQELAARRPYRDVVMFRRLRDGSKNYISVSGEPIFDNDGRFVGYRGVTREITLQKTAEARIQYLATHDGLTASPNRFMFNQLLVLAIESARRYQRKFAVLFIDLDRFKVINDTLGHAAGDMLLKEISVRLRACLRGSDIVARLGGDEFVVLLQEINEPQQVIAAARKLLDTITKPLAIAGHDCRVTASIGIAMYPGDGNDEEMLMKNADIAMYRAKEEGKNNFQFYARNMKSQSVERLDLESGLRRALEREEFSVLYQARVDLRTEKITGVEALLRWRHPELGNVSPAQFIPLAEEVGLIVPIGRWVLSTACRQSVAWQRAGLPPVCLAVNLSARQFSDRELLANIESALSESGLDPTLLELEITEGMVIQNPERTMSLFAAIKAMGPRLAIDDFGTGYSSLAQLKRFPIDTLKIDRSFICDIPRDTEDKAITQAIIAMAKTLGLTVVAEGVETAEQAQFLRDHGCDEMQGFYFSKPLAAADFAELLHRHDVATERIRRKA